MASAPTPGGPGTSSNEEAVDMARKIMRMTVKDESRTLALGNIPTKERIVVRQATGLPIEAFVGDGNKIGEDSLIVMWWLAGRAAGNAFLTFEQADAAWPRPLTEGDITVEVVDANDEGLDGTDPESSGPGSTGPGPA